MLNKHEAKHYNGNSKFNMLNKLLAFVVVSVILLINTTSGILSYLTAKTSITNVFTLARTYTVEFNANGGTGTMPDQEIPINTYTNLDTNLFTRQDFVFTEWNTQPDGSGTSYDDGESVIDITAEDATIILYAQWEELLGVAEVNGQYFDSLQAAINAAPNNTKTTVRLLTNVSEDVSIASNKNIVFNLQNYTITGTSNGSVATIENNGILEIQNGTITKVANIEPAVINNNAGATLKVTGGSIIGIGSKKSQAIYNNNATLEVSGNAYISSESSNRSTITSINGAHTTITGGTIISENQSAVSNTKIINQDTVGDVIIVGTEDGNVDITTPVIQGYVYGIQSSSSGIEFYDGIIKGYNKAVNNDNDILNIEDGYEVEDETEIIDGVTYKTKYLSQNNYVTFDGNGGTASQTRKFVDVGDQVGALPTATLQGHVFIGWFTDPVNGTQITENTLVTGYDIYYAHYLEALTIQYNANGGMVDTSSVEVLEGQTLGTMPTPIKSRSRFDGWFTSADGGTEITPSTPITESGTLYAHWTTIDAARVNGTDYPTLQAAINVVPTTGVETVVELLCYDEENVTVAAGKNIVFSFNGNTLKNEVNTAPVIYNNGEIKITDGTITSSGGYAVINNYNKLVITGGSVIGTGNRQAVYNDAGMVEISGSAYLRSENLATDKERGTVHNISNGTISIKGGTIVALKMNGVYNEKGTLTIGEDDGTVSTTSPVIQGAKNGIKNTNNGRLYFYDGIVKVPTAQTLISGTVTGKPTGYDFVNGTETIDGAGYKTSYLDVVP